jgi:Ca2+-binding RTX toxin-like protein
MRRTTLLLVAMGCLLVIFAGVAVAVSQTGTNTANTPSLTQNPDKYAGGGGNDTILGKGGNDILFGDHGNVDTIDGGADDDFLNSADSVGGDRVTAAGNTAAGDVCVVDEGDFINSTEADPLLHAAGTSVGTCEETYVIPNP